VETGVLLEAKPLKYAFSFPFVLGVAGVIGATGSVETVIRTKG